MPFGEPEPDDPHVLVGVSLPAGAEAVREMAEAVADEFAAMGLDEERIMGLFRRPFYAGAHRAMAILGEDAVRQIIQESLRVWGRIRIEVRDAPRAAESGGVIQIGRSTVAKAAPDGRERE